MISSRNFSFEMLRAAPVGRLMLALMVLSLAAACQNPASRVTLAGGDYKQRHPFFLRHEAEKLVVPLAPTEGRLSAQMLANIHGFAAGAMRAGPTNMQIDIPVDGRNDLMAHTTAKQVEQALLEAGVNQNRIVKKMVHAGARGGKPSARWIAPIEVSYQKLKAMTHECGRWPRSVNGDFENTQYYNFGCSTQQNLAAMVDEPTDLFMPRAVQPGDQNRRNRVNDRFRKGTVTGSEYKEGLGSISGIGE